MICTPREIVDYMLIVGSCGRECPFQYVCHRAGGYPWSFSVTQLVFPRCNGQESNFLSVWCKVIGCPYTLHNRIIVLLYKHM